MNELLINENTVQVKAGLIQFNDYDLLLKQANELKELMKKSEVSEETVKTNKKLLAAVRKKRDELETMRKDAKKAINKTYEEFAPKVKDITDVLDEADSYVDKQVKELEEIETLKKKQEIEELFNLRGEMYDNFPLNFEQFLIEFPKVLNKSESMTKVEKSLADWFESKQNDLTAISNLPNAEEVMTEYIAHPDSLSRAMSIVTSRAEQARKAREVVQKNNPEKQEFKFKVNSVEDAQKLEQFMNDNNIKYTTY